MSALAGYPRNALMKYIIQHQRLSTQWEKSTAPLQIINEIGDQTLHLVRLSMDADNIPHYSHKFMQRATLPVYPFIDP